ncbi:hypothetical protein ILUMI_14708, partial [Ignelater luminosus]
MSKVPHPPSYSSPLSQLPSTNKNPNPYAVDGELPKNPSRSSSSNIRHVNSFGNSRMFSNVFYVIKKLTGDFSQDNPFIIERVIRTEIEQVKAVKKIREGLLVEVANFTQSKKICQMQTLGGQPITVVPHERLNYTKGIISHRDLLNCSVDEIAEALSEDGVVEAKLMITKRNGVSVNTAS